MCIFPLILGVRKIHSGPQLFQWGTMPPPRSYATALLGRGRHGSQVYLGAVPYTGPYIIHPPTWGPPWSWLTPTYCINQPPFSHVSQAPQFLHSHAAGPCRDWSVRECPESGVDHRHRIYHPQCTVGGRQELQPGDVGPHVKLFSLAGPLIHDLCGI